MRVSRCPNAYAWRPESRKKPYLGGHTQTGKRRNPKYHANRYPDHLRQRRRSPPAAGSAGQRGHRVRPDQRIHRIDTTQPVRHDGDGRHGRSAGEGLRPGPAAVKRCRPLPDSRAAPIAARPTSGLRWGAAADSRHFLRSFRYWPGRRSAISRLPTAAAVAGRISANRLHLPDKLPETASQALPRTRIRRRNNASVPPRRPPRPRDPLPAPPRKPACTAEPILFPARLAGNEKRRIFIVPFMKNGYPKLQET